MSDSKITELASIFVGFINQLNTYGKLENGEWVVLCTNSAVIPSTSRNNQKILPQAGLCLAVSENSVLNRKLVSQIYESIDNVNNVPQDSQEGRAKKIEDMHGSFVMCYYENKTDSFFIQSNPLG